jgi:hypothetical protein
MPKIKSILLASLIATILLYTRFVNLGWGFPYPIHPDERNMAIAITELNVANYLRPGFYAYGQLPLYLGYVAAHLLLLNATLSLRLISALASIITALILVKIIQNLSDTPPKMKPFFTTISFLIVIFSPFFIQFSHFGTTESLLMLFYVLLTYLSLVFITNKISVSQFLIMSSIIGGLAVATKVSAAIFITLPLFVLLSTIKRPVQTKDIIGIIFLGLGLSGLTLITSFVFSPYNALAANEFLGALDYESGVATGKFIVFYTRQFIDTTPLLFQMVKIFPYALGLPVFILTLLGFFFLSWNKKEFNLIRLALLVYLLPTSFIFAKWARFAAPVMPLMLLMASLFLFSFLKNKKLLLLLIVLVSIVPGIAYLPIYTRQDIRFTASRWIYENIPLGSYILSEGGNVVDIPLKVQGLNKTISSYQYHSFDFYRLDNDPVLQEELKNHLKNADYIIVPSRRVFMNHNQKDYPVTYAYYDNLFSGKTSFKKVAEFTSYPKITFLGKTLIEFPDETAEETWSVFDHPVIRIYKRS